MYPRLKECSRIDNYLSKFLFFVVVASRDSMQTSLGGKLERSHEKVRDVNQKI